MDGPLVSRQAYTTDDYQKKTNEMFAYPSISNSEDAYKIFREIVMKYYVNNLFLALFQFCIMGCISADGQISLDFH